MSTTLTPLMLMLLCGAMFVVALLYASVGHGGASGYLAVWSLFALEPNRMVTSALCLNLVVAGVAWALFAQAGHFSRRLTWPFVVASVPAAFLGGWLQVPVTLYGWLLAMTLLVAAVRLVWVQLNTSVVEVRRPSLAIAVPVGAGVGLVSGIVGVGGGIFLSPLILLLGWGTPHSVAATSACFIVVTSAAGLVGRLAAGQWILHGTWPMLVSALLGGIVGARLGSNHFSGQLLRRLLAVTLVVASIKLFLRLVS